MGWKWFCGKPGPTSRIRMPTWVGVDVDVDVDVVGCVLVVSVWLL